MTNGLGSFRPLTSTARLGPEVTAPLTCKGAWRAVGASDRCSRDQCGQQRTYTQPCLLKHWDLPVQPMVRWQSHPPALHGPQGFSCGLLASELQIEGTTEGSGAAAAAGAALCPAAYSQIKRGITSGISDRRSMGAGTGQVQGRWGIGAVGRSPAIWFL